MVLHNHFGKNNNDITFQKFKSIMDKLDHQLRVEADARRKKKEGKHAKRN